MLLDAPMSIRECLAFSLSLAACGGAVSPCDAGMDAMADTLAASDACSILIARDLVGFYSGTFHSECTNDTPVLGLDRDSHGSIRANESDPMTIVLVDDDLRECSQSYLDSAPT